MGKNHTLSPRRYVQLHCKQIIKDRPHFGGLSLHPLSTNWFHKSVLSVEECLGRQCIILYYCDDDDDDDDNDDDDDDDDDC